MLASPTFANLLCNVYHLQSATHLSFMIQGLRGWNCWETKPQPGTLREVDGWVGGDEIDDDPLSAEIPRSWYYSCARKWHPNTPRTHMHTHTNQSSRDLGNTFVSGNEIQTYPTHIHTNTNQSSRDFGTFRLLLCKEMTSKHNQRHTQTSQVGILVLLLCKEKKIKHTHTHTHKLHTHFPHMQTMKSRSWNYFCVRKWYPKPHTNTHTHTHTTIKQTHQRCN